MEDNARFLGEAKDRGSSLWIYTDADNTLWDTDAVFANAQLLMLQGVERINGKTADATDRLDFVRTYDQALALRHHAKLRYPPALLIRALAAALQGESADAVANRLILAGVHGTVEEIALEQQYLTSLRELPPLLPHVLEGLSFAMDRSIGVYVITEGPQEVLLSRLTAHGIEQFVTGTLSAAKTVELYQRLKQRAAQHVPVMIGDQPDRDIRLAREAGMSAILVASRFRPSWTTSQDAASASAVAADYLEAIRVAAALAAGRQ